MNNEEMKRSLRELCRIESVAGIDVSDDAPYGAGCAQALDYALELCRRLGFETKLCDKHRCGWAQIGAQARPWSGSLRIWTSCLPAPAGAILPMT